MLAAIILTGDDMRLGIRATVAASVLLASSGLWSQVQAQQMDMEAMMRWASVDVVRYHIVGEYQGQASIASDASGQADVTDRVVIDLTWKLSEAKLVGTPTFENGKTTVANLRDREPSCLAPILKGEYEHYELLGIKDGMGGSLELQVQTSYPVAEVAQFCTASRKPVPASQKTRAEDFPMLSPVMFGMPLPDSDNLRVSPDRKSLVHKKNGWTWTFTPSAAAGQ